MHLYFQSMQLMSISQSINGFVKWGFHILMVVKCIGDNMVDGTPTSNTAATGIATVYGYHWVIRSANDVTISHVLGVEVHPVDLATTVSISFMDFPCSWLVWVQQMDALSFPMIWLFQQRDFQVRITLYRYKKHFSLSLLLLLTFEISESILFSISFLM